MGSNGGSPHSGATPRDDLDEVVEGLRLGDLSFVFVAAARLGPRIAAHRSAPADDQDRFVHEVVLALADRAVVPGARRRSPEALLAEAVAASHPLRIVGTCSGCRAMSARPGGEEQMMVPIDRDEVARLMARMAAGDPAALFALIASFGGRLAAVVRRQLFELGRRDVVAERDEVDYLVQSAALVLYDKAASWSPDGALPWTWADRAIRAEVVRYLGHPSVELELDRLDGAATTAAPGSSSGAAAGSGSPSGSTGGSGDGRAGAAGTPEFHELAARFPTVGLLEQAIDAVANDRDRRVHVEYRIQKRCGDASPAHTVAAQFGLTPENVRQIDSRVRRRLRTLIDTDPRYTDLRTLGWLAA